MYLKDIPTIKEGLDINKNVVTVPGASVKYDYIGDIRILKEKLIGSLFSDEAMEKLSVLFDDARLQDDFGNGRYVRNLIELSKMNQACRILNKDPDELSDADLTLIEDVDIDVPMCKPRPKINPIGFAS